MMEREAATIQIQMWRLFLEIPSSLSLSLSLASHPVSSLRISTFTPNTICSSLAEKELAFPLWLFSALCFKISDIGPAPLWL